MFNASFPFAELSVFRNALRLNCLGKDYVFPKSNIAALARFRGLFSTGLLIRHSVPLYPEFVVFWVSVFWSKSRFEKLSERLRMLGYDVTG
jgi:hypothetical protein